jgi:hypothetical protein
MSLRLLCSSLLVLALATPPLASAADGEVSYATRLGKKNRVYVDVENGSEANIQVTSMVVVFYDRDKAILEKSTIPCDADCAVDARDAGSFGPIDGPDGWHTVKVTNVLYEEAEETAPQPKPAPRSTTAPKAPPASSPGPPPVPIPIDGKRESFDGYAEWWRDDLLIVDGQRVRLGAGAKFKGSKEVKTFSDIPLGHEVRVKGRRDAQGVLIADEVETKQNGDALFEGDLRTAFDEREQKYLSERRMYEEGDNGQRADYGRLYTRGEHVDRVRGILDRLIPGYLAERDFRIYVVENKEWNAMAAPNDSLYIFTGLLDDMDDDEVAIILGHELAHATHEHSRKGFKKTMLIQLAALGIAAIAEEAVDGKNKRQVIQVAAMLGASAWANGYGRGHEDQADRVGMRYANEGGFDVRKGPRLWNRFAERYGNDPKLLNFFFSNHSVAQDRARNLNRELALNYRR